MQALGVGADAGSARGAVAALLEQVGLRADMAPGAIRTNSPAASASASRSRARWR